MILLGFINPEYVPIDKSFLNPLIRNLKKTVGYLLFMTNLLFSVTKIRKIAIKNKMARSQLFLMCFFFCSFHLYAAFSQKPSLEEINLQIVCYLYGPVFVPNRPRHCRYLTKSFSHLHHSSSSTYQAIVLLLFLLSGDIELNPGPGNDKDVVKHVCLTQEDTGHMIECESCWSHSECVNISPTVAANYPLICPYCVKSLVSSVSVLTV